MPTAGALPDLRLQDEANTGHQIIDKGDHFVKNSQSRYFKVHFHNKGVTVPMQATGEEFLHVYTKMDQ